MHHDEAFEFFMEVKNKEIKELKEKLERDNAASNAMINAGIKNRRKMTEAGDALYNYISCLYDIESEKVPDKYVTSLLYNWQVANYRAKPL